MSDQGNIKSSVPVAVIFLFLGMAVIAF